MMIARRWFAEVDVYYALIIFVPMIGAVGGNSGIQISTIIVRGLATGDLAGSKFLPALLREGRIHDCTHGRESPGLGLLGGQTSCS